MKHILLYSGGLPVAVSMATLAETWFNLPGLAERGASGRLIVGPVNLTRADLVFNWDVVAHAIVWAGCRPGIEPLTDSAEDFFQMSRCRGKAPTTRSLATQLRVLYFKLLNII